MLATFSLAAQLILATSIGSFLVNAGEVTGGGAVFGATIGYVLGSLLEAFGVDVDRRHLAEDGAGLGGTFGIFVVIFQALGVK